MIEDIKQQEDRIDKLFGSPNRNDQLIAAFFTIGLFPYPWYHIKGRLMMWFTRVFAINFNGWTEQEVNDHIQRGREYAQKIHDYRKLRPSPGTQRDSSQSQ